MGTVTVLVQKQTPKFEPESYPSQINMGSMGGGGALALVLFFIILIPIAIINKAKQPNKATMQRIESNKATLKSTLVGVRPQAYLQQAVESRIRALGEFGVASSWMSEQNDSKATDYTSLSKRGVDAVIEVNVYTVSCGGKIATNVGLRVTASVRIVLTANNKQVYAASASFRDLTRDRYFSKWAEFGGSAFATELRRGLDEIATAFVDEMFLRYDPSAHSEPVAGSKP